jgi:hypothetical protein
MSDQRKGRRGRGVQRDTVAVPTQRTAAARVRGGQRKTVAITRYAPTRLRGVLTAGIVTSVWNCLVVLLPVLLAVIGAWWAVGRPGAVSDVVRTAGAIWLLGHGVPVGVAGLTVGVAPLLLTGVVFWRLARAGGNTIKAIRGRNFPAVRAATLSVVVGYTLVVTGIAFLVSGQVYAVQPWRAALHAAVLSLVAASLGALAQSGGSQALWYRFPVWLRRGMRSGALATTITMAAGALAVGASLAVRGGPVADTVGAYQGGAVGLGVLSLLYVPTVAVWGAAYLLGPGFAVGVATQVSVIAVDVLPLPVFPLFAAVPQAPLDSWGTVLWGVPLAIGSMQGVLLALRSMDLRLSRLLWAAVLSGVTAAAVTAVLVFAASGSLGNGQLAVVGPSIGTTSLAAGLAIGVSVLLGAVVARLLGARRTAQGHHDDR